MEARGAIVLNATDTVLENSRKTDGRRYGEDLTRTEIVDFNQNAG